MQMEANASKLPERNIAYTPVKNIQYGGMYVKVENLG